MSPQSASRGPVERGYVERIHCPDTEQLAASVGGLGRTYDDFCLIFGIPSWLMPIRDRSGQRWQPSGKPYVVAATEVCSRFIGTCRELRRTHSTYMFNEACLGSLMRFGFIGFRPLHLFPFSSFPLRTPLFLFLFMSSLASCPFISLLSFFCAYNGPSLSVYAHIYDQLRFQVAQVSTMGVHRLSPCIWFLFHRNHTHFCPVLLSFLRAHLHIGPSLNFASPRGGVCV